MLYEHLPQGEKSMAFIYFLPMRWVGHLTPQLLFPLNFKPVSAIKGTPLRWWLAEEYLILQ